MQILNKIPSAARFASCLVLAISLGACSPNNSTGSSSEGETSLSTPFTQSVALESATFSIDKMTCATCPAAVRTAMRKVDGVEAVNVDFGSRQALVSYDPALTTPTLIAAASTSVGFPASLVDEVK